MALTAWSSRFRFTESAECADPGGAAWFAWMAKYFFLSSSVKVLTVVSELGLCIFSSLKRVTYPSRTPGSRGPSWQLFLVFRKTRKGGGNWGRGESRRTKEEMGRGREGWKEGDGEK